MCRESANSSVIVVSSDNFINGSWLVGERIVNVSMYLCSTLMFSTVYKKIFLKKKIFQPVLYLLANPFGSTFSVKKTGLLFLSLGLYFKLSAEFENKLNFMETEEVHACGNYLNYNYWTNNIKPRMEIFQLDFTLTLKGKLVYGATHKEQYIFLKFQGNSSL